MGVCLEMAFSYFFLFLVFVVGQGEGHNGCHELIRRGGSGQNYTIRFPFRLDTQPEHCGYPGFTLSSANDTAVLVLRNLERTVGGNPYNITDETVLRIRKLFVENIDYKSQVIKVYYPDGSCPSGTFLDQSLEYSPFKPASWEQPQKYTLFNCSSDETQYFSTRSCFRSPIHQVRAFQPDADINDLPIASCKKMYTAQSTSSDQILSFYDNILKLTWHFEGKGKGVLLKLKITGIVFSSFLSIVLVVFALYRVHLCEKAEQQNQAKIKTFLEDYKNFKPMRFSYADIKRITNKFVEKLGEGAYGTVFKGKLSNKVHVAVKMIMNTSKENGEEFINEVGTMGRIHHVNVVRLVGFCADGFRRALVYEFLPNYSLEKFISSVDTKNRFLGWDKLQDIAIGIAKGIDYLHQGCDQQILHFDIKPHNVLLDENFNPKISDFGLAKLCSKDQSAVSMTTARGTLGYIAPEVFSRNFGNVSYKSDIYSFGILLLEVVGGRKNVDITAENTSQVYFPEWIYNFLEQKEDLRVFIEDDEDAEIAKKLAIIGLWCIQWHPVDRPSMKVIIQMLEGGHKLTMPPNPFASTSPTRPKLDQKLDVILEQE
ncbi:rust resistance kinase Lr10-like [Corylus avellana]|uniref:rust resistance kinase Lr10-like n=1 Tax=Corylus avellana TaxID=13451 RepID=UPI00286AE89E|nr:rust resistance kinase Lr10-like [Corylus avellana]